MKSVVWSSVLLVLVVIAVNALTPVVHAELSPGDILVVDWNAGTGGLGALFRVDPSTGARTILSDFGNAGQGPTGKDPNGVAVESSGNILVIDLNAGTGGLGALFRVDPSTGARTLLSDFGNAGQGPTGIDPAGVAVESSGNILVIDESAGTGGLGALFRVDPSTGARTLLSDFGNAGQGPTGIDPFGVAVECSGNILVIDPGTQYGTLGALFRVDPSTGLRTLLSDFANAGQGPTGVNPDGVAVECSGNILVIDWDAGTGYHGALFRVDPSTGARTVLSDFGVGTGPITATPVGIAIESSGNILVADHQAGTGGLGILFRVDPSTGARTLLSDFGVGTPPGDAPVGVAVYRVLSCCQPVGGTVMPTNRLEILTLYLALAGLVAAVSAVVVLRKRR